MGTNKKTVFISGATSGIGFAIAQKYLDEGYFVVLNYNNGGMSLQDAGVVLKQKGYIQNTDYLFLQADIGNETSLSEKLSTLPDNIVKNTEILINNAAILKRSNIVELNQADWINVFNVNVFGAVFLSKWFYTNSPNLNNIINIGSIRGMSSVTRVNNAAYSISKSTIPALTALQAKTFGSKVRVNAILPGTINTPQRQGIHPEEQALFGEKNSIIPRLGEPVEIAEMCFFITSNKVGYMTGSSLIVDGGYSINYIH